MSIVTKVTVGADDEFAHVQLKWTEPGEAGASLSFEVAVRTFPNEPTKDIENNAVNEAARAAKAFLGFYDKGTK